MAPCQNIMVLEFQRQGEFFELEAKAMGGTYDWNSESMGVFLEGTDKSVNTQTN